MVKSSVIYTNISPIMVLSATNCKSIFFGFIYKTTYLAHCLCMVWSNFPFFKGLSVYPFKTLCLLYLSFVYLLFYRSLFIVFQTPNTGPSWPNLSCKNYRMRSWWFPWLQYCCKILLSLASINTNIMKILILNTIQLLHIPHDFPSKIYKECCLLEKFTFLQMQP